MRGWISLACVIAVAAAGCDGTGDTSGAVTATEHDVNGDGAIDLVVGAPLDGGGGRVYVFFGPLSPQGPDLLTTGGSVPQVPTTEADVILGSELRQDGQPRPDSFGAAVATGDLNGDGIADIVVGAPGFDGAGPDASIQDTNIGRTYLFLGGSNLASGTAAEADAILYGERRVTGDPVGGSFGFALEAADLDGDGSVDVIVGAVGYDSGKGRAYLFRGPRLAPGARIEAQTADRILAGEAENDLFGYAFAAGDIGGNGVPDLVVGAPDAGPGRAYVFPGGPALMTGPLLGAAQANVVLDGETPGDGFGTAVRAADYDADGTPDVAVGAPGYDLAVAAPGEGEGVGVASGIGRCYVFLARTIESKTASLADVIITGENAGDLFGSSVGAGDVDADARVDLIVGAPGAGEGVYDIATARLEGEDAGRAYVFRGGAGFVPVDGATVRLGALDAVLRLTGERTDERLGSAVTAADVNHDGIADILAGAPPQLGAGIRGAAFVVLGTPGLADDLLTHETPFAVVSAVVDDEFATAIR